MLAVSRWGSALPAHQLYPIGLEYHWGSALPVLKSVSTWMGDHPVGRKNYPKLFLTKNFYWNNFFSCDEQLKKWRCHSVRSFVRPLYPYFYFEAFEANFVVLMFVVFHQCFTGILPVFHQCFATVLPVFSQCFGSVSPMFQQCFTSISLVFHQYFISVSPVFQQSFTRSVLPVFCQCFTNVSSVFC